MYNLGVKVQPGCEPSNTCWQNNPVWSTFYGIPCWCDTRYMVWCTTYSVNKMSMVWWASLVVWSTIYSSITWSPNHIPNGVMKHQMVWSNKFVEKNDCSHQKWCDSTMFWCDQNLVWCDVFTCFFLMNRGLLPHSYQRICNQYHCRQQKIPRNGIHLRPTTHQLATRCNYYLVVRILVCKNRGTFELLNHKTRQTTPKQNWRSA